jgi:hypothetical protein
MAKTGRGVLVPVGPKLTLVGVDLKEFSEYWKINAHCSWT